ncbi:sulfate adenylyltransferase [Planctomycetota bacterium]
MDNKKIKIIVSLGPSTNKEEDIRKIKDRGVDFVRVNMSHSSTEDLEYFIKLSKKIGVPFIIDTEGSQIRVGDLEKESLCFEEGEVVKIFEGPCPEDGNAIYLKPPHVTEQLAEGDLVHIDFDSLILKVADVSSLKQGYVIGEVITGGTVGRNKAVVIDSAIESKLPTPPLSDKDYESIKIGLREGIGHIAVSYVRSAEDIREVRKASNNEMKIISKVECVDALENIDEIIDESDYLLLDRGDLSKEIPIEKLPFTQKIILNKARNKNKSVFVATNLLETMIKSKEPTKAEVNDVVNTILDGAQGLILAAETAIGKYPIRCINMLNKIINHAGLVVGLEDLFNRTEKAIVESLEKSEYLLNTYSYGTLIEPHGGKLINRMAKEVPCESELKNLKKIRISQEKQMDVEQIAIGTFSPLEGFMGKKDLRSVLDSMRLSNGVIWPIPIFLDISEDQAKTISIGDDVGLLDDEGKVMAMLCVEGKYRFNKEELLKKMFGTNSDEHPGVKELGNMGPVFLSGKIELLRRRKTGRKKYELIPKQVRKLFGERGWMNVAGFHTRNVIHRSHEFIQMKSIENNYCDGLFVHPVIGKKKPGDFNSDYIIKSYELMMQKFYPKDKVVFATFETYSRYMGPREAVFTAICRKNFGCSHFIVGRDHTGVKDFYPSYASQEIFDQFPDLGINVIKFDEVFYSNRLNGYVDLSEHSDHPEDDKLSISGTEARKMLKNGEFPPEWFMRPEISQMIVGSILNGEDVFVK